MQHFRFVSFPVLYALFKSQTVDKIVFMHVLVRCYNNYFFLFWSYF